MINKIKDRWECRKILGERGIRCAGEGRYSCRTHKKRGRHTTRRSVEITDIVLIVVAEQCRSLPPDQRLKLLQDALLKVWATGVAHCADHATTETKPALRSAYPEAQPGTLSRRPEVCRAECFQPPEVSVEEQLARLAQSCAAAGIFVNTGVSPLASTDASASAAKRPRNPKAVRQGPLEDPQQHLARLLAEMPEGQRELVRTLFEEHPDLLDASRRLDRELKIKFRQTEDGAWLIERVCVTSC